MFTLPKSIKVFSALVISIFSGTLLSAQINFNNPGLNGASAAGAAPPQWVVCSSTPDIQPGQWCVDLPAFEGATYAGFSDDEFIGQRLNCSLVKGKNYSMSLYLAYNPDYARTQALGLCPDAGIRGNAGNFQLWAGKAQCTKQELLYESGTLSAAHENNWIQHVIKFKPNDTYDFILLCAKPDDGSTNVLVDAISQTIVQEPDSFSVDNSNLLCFGDKSATATVYPPNATGSNYTYSWNTNPVQTTQTATGLGVGVYTCTVTDNNGPCTASFKVSVTVTGPAKLEVNTICTDVSLPGVANGTSTATIVGGTPPYNIVWSTGDVGMLALTNLDAGTYTVTVTDKNGCKATASCAIINPFCNLSLDNSVAESPKCFGVDDGSIEVNASTSNPPLAYSWNTSPVQTTNEIEDLGPGVYTVTITDDAGCTLSESFVLDAPPPLQLILSGDSATCFDGDDASAIAQASGGVAPYSFSWPGSSTANYQGPAGAIVCTLSDDNGCIVKDTISLGEPEEFNHTVTFTNTSCPEISDATIQNELSGGTAPYSYGLQLGSLQSNPIISNVAPGLQWVYIQDAKGCIDSLEVEILSDTVTITVPNDTSICEGQSVVLAASNMEQIFWDNNLANNSVQTPNSSKDFIAYGNNASGCAAQDTFKVNVIPFYDPTIIPAGPFCKGSPDFQLSAVDTGGIWSGPNLSAQGVFSPSSLSDGTYWLHYEFPGVCGDKDSIEVLVNSSFDASINPVDTLCHGEASFKLSSVTNGGLWYGPGMQGNSTDSLSANFSTQLSGPGKHRVFHLIPGECGDTAFIDIVVLAPDTGKIVNPGPLCSDASNLVLSATPNNGIWSGNEVSSVGDFNPSSLLPDSSYQVYYTPAGFCVLTDSSEIQVLAPLVLTADTFHLNCFGDNNGQLNAMVTGGLEPYTYQWTPGGYSTANISGLSAGTYLLNVQDAASCSSSEAYEVIAPNDLIFSSPTAVVDDSCSAACKGQITAFISGGTAPYQYRVNGQAWQNESVFSGLCAGVYNLEVLDANGCQISETHNILEPAPIQIADSVVTDFCLQGVGEIILKNIFGGTAPYQFSWSNGGSTQSLNGLTAGTYNVVISDAKACSQSFSFTVPNYGGPQLSLGSYAAICEGQANGKAFVSASGGTPGYSYSWNTGASGDTLFNVGAGTYQVTVTDASGCNAQADVQVTEPSAVSLETINDSLLCDGQQFIYTPSIQGGNGAPYSLELNGNVLANYEVNISLSGGYTLQAFDARGCPSNFSSFQISYRDPISLDFQADSICPGASTSLQLNPEGGLGTYTYEWAHGATGNPVEFQSTAQGLADTAYVTINDGCSNPLQVSIPVPFYNNATPQITLSPQNGCVPLSSQFQVADLGFQSVEWQLGDGQVISNQIQFTHVYTQAGDYRPILKVISAEGCFNEVQAPLIKVYPLPTGRITQFPSVITEANNEASFAIAGSNVAGAEWTLSRLGDTLLNSNTYPLTYVFSRDTGSFELFATMISVHGCEALVSRTVLVRKELRLFIPNAFTPNGDGSNDAFNLEATGLEAEDFSISIHNRWGEQVFHSKDPNFAWDGMYMGEEALTGTYAWAIKYVDALGNPQTLMGVVTLIR